MFAILFSLILSANAMSYKKTADNTLFWDQLQIKSILNTPSSYNVYRGEKVCFTCPFSSKMFSDFYEIESKRSNTPLIGLPKIPIKWTSFISGKNYNMPTQL